MTTPPPTPQGTQPFTTLIARSVAPGTTALISVRALDANYDPIWGQGQNCFLLNIDAVAQTILTRLRLFEGEWWASLTDGLPLWQSILGVTAAPRQQAAASLAIQERILQTSYVTGIQNTTYSYNTSTSTFNFTAVVSTPFGAITVSNVPTPPSGAIPTSPTI